MKRAWSIKEVEDGLQLQGPPDFSYSQNVNYLSRSALECLYEIEGERVIRAIRLANKPVLIEISGKERLLNVKLLTSVAAGRSDVLAEIAAYVGEWFDLERDMRPFYELAARDPVLQGAAKAYAGLRVMGIPELFEALAWGIIGQQINLPFAYRLKRRLVERYGDAAVHGGRTYYMFPAAEKVADLTVGAMDGLQLTVKKREYLIDTAQLIAGGKLTKSALLEAGSMRQAERMLTEIRGIGPWTANYVLMRCLRFADAFPIDDVGLQLAVKSVLGLDRKPFKSELVDLSAHWRGWEAYAVFYLWRLLY